MTLKHPFIKKWAGKSLFDKNICLFKNMKAIIENEIIAQSNDTIEIEGNHYFPPESISEEFLVMSSTRTTCSWKGEATYYDVIIDGKVRKDAAWSYHEPEEEALMIKDHFAFWRGIRVVPD